MPWEPSDSMDFAGVAALTIAGVSLALAALYVAANRKRPALYAMVPGLVLWSALAGMVTNLAVALRYGWWGTLTAKPDHPISCTGEAWLLWLGGGAFFACAFLRVYRNHKVLIRHNSVMWPVPLQLGVVLLPLLFPPAILMANPGLLVVEEDTQECERQSNMPEAFVLGATVVLTAGTVALTHRLRAVRFQAPAEFGVAKTTSATLLVAVLVLPALHEGLEGRRDKRRKAMLVASSLSTVAIVVIPLWGNIKALVWAHDVEQKTRTTIQPGTVLKIARDRLKINAVASSPEGRDMPGSSAMAWFFRDSLDREIMQDYFLIQASTMRILSRYIWEGAPMFINLSSACRVELLTTEASCPFIFARARQEVMDRMGGGAVTYCLSPSGTISPDDSISGDGISSDSLGISTTNPRAPPKPNQRQRELPVGALLARHPRANLAHRAKHASKASVSGGEMKRNGLGRLGGTSHVSTAFGLNLRVNHGRSSEDGLSREKRGQLFVGRSRTSSNASDVEGGLDGAGVIVRGRGADGSDRGGADDNDGSDGSGGSGGGGGGGGREAFSLEEVEQQREKEAEEGAAIAVASGPAGSDSLDDLDPFRGLQGSFDFNFFASSYSFPDLSASSRLPETRSRSHVAGNRNTTHNNNEVSISVSSDGGDDEDDDDDDGDGGGGEVVVVSPLFVDGLNRTVPRQIG